MLNTSSQRGANEGFSLQNIEQKNSTAILDFLKPETTLECELLEQPCFKDGLFWGVPRYGHPEGEVIYHIKEVLDNIDKLDVSTDCRAMLRLVAFIHDTFKYKEHKGFPRDWTQHHAILARQFAEGFIHDQKLLDIIELHDEAYHIWIQFEIKKNKVNGQKRLDAFLNKMNGSIQFYYLFFKCDTQTGDKNQAPVKWFEENIKGISIMNF